MSENAKPGPMGGADPKVVEAVRNLADVLIPNAKTPHAGVDDVSDAAWLAEQLAEGLFLQETGPEKCDGAVTSELMASRQIQSWREEGEAACLPVLLRALDVYAAAFGYNDVGEVLRWLDKRVGKLGGDGGAPLDPFAPVGPR